MKTIHASTSDTPLSSVDELFGQWLQTPSPCPRHVPAALSPLVEARRPSRSGSPEDLRRPGMCRGRLCGAPVHPGLVLEALSAVEGERRPAGHAAPRARFGQYHGAGLQDRFCGRSSAGQCSRHIRAPHRAVRQDRPGRSRLPLVPEACEVGFPPACTWRLGRRPPRPRQAEQ